METLTEKIIKIQEKLQRTYNSSELYPNDRVISSSQIVTALTRKEDFYKTYIVGEKNYSLPMIIGVLFSEYYAGNEEAIGYLRELEVDNYIVERLIDAKKKIVKAEKCEEEIKVPLKNYIIRVTLDGFITNPLIVIENKTGKKEWNEIRVEDDIQLDLQAWAVWKTYKKNPKIILNWVDLNSNSKKPIKSFETKRQVAYLKKFEAEKLIPIIEMFEDGSILN
jgi:hypothetical protein